MVIFIMQLCFITYYIETFHNSNNIFKNFIGQLYACGQRRKRLEPRKPVRKFLQIFRHGVIKGKAISNAAF